jgi:copper chaperone
MTSFQVKDMTCNHCVKSITTSVHSVAPEASVLCDVAAHTVTVSGQHDDKLVENAIKEAGYTPVRQSLTNVVSPRS